MANEKTIEKKATVNTNSANGSNGHASKKERLPVMKTYKIFIGGKFPRTESGRYYQPKDAEGKPLANIDAVVHLGGNAFEKFRTNRCVAIKPVYGNPRASSRARRLDLAQYPSLHPHQGRHSIPAAPSFAVPLPRK